MSDILEIRMNPGLIGCSVCGATTEFRWGLPTYNGDIVSNDFPNDLHHAGGGMVAVCERCHDLHARGGMVVCDHYYVRPGAVLIDGAGI